MKAGSSCLSKGGKEGQPHACFDGAQHDNLLFNGFDNESQGHPELVEGGKANHTPRFDRDNSAA